MDNTAWTTRGYTPSGRIGMVQFSHGRNQFAMEGGAAKLLCVAWPSQHRKKVGDHVDSEGLGGVMGHAGSLQ
jgi:hypothetical protein